MDREHADNIIRKAYDEMREGFTPERPSWDELSASQRAELSVFAHAIIATSKDIDHAIRARLSLMADEVAGAQYDVDRVTGERDTYRKSLDTACDALRRERHSHEETIGQRNDARRELRILATLVLTKQHVGSHEDRSAARRTGYQPISGACAMTTETTELRSIDDVTDDEIVAAVANFGIDGFKWLYCRTAVTVMCKELRIANDDTYALDRHCTTLVYTKPPRLAINGNWVRLSPQEWARKIATRCGIAMNADVAAITDMLTNKY